MAKIDSKGDVAAAGTVPNTADIPEELTFYPFAYALLEDELNTHCWHCLNETTTELLQRCKGCKVAYFCDKSCQIAGWTDHKPECKGFAATANRSGANGVPIIPNIEVRMLGRIAHRHLCIEEGRDGKDSAFYKNRTSNRKIMDIWSHTEEMRKDKKARNRFQDIFVKLQCFYQPKFLPSSEETIFQLHCRNYINRHAINDQGYMREIGKGLYLDLCEYDHSCAPTAIYICNGIVAKLRALQPGLDIRDRSKTFYTYIDLLNSKEERRAMLLDSWYFTCHCARCEDPRENVLTGIRCPKCLEPVPLKGLKSMNADVTCPTCSQGCTSMQIEAGKRAMREIEQIIDSKKLGKSMDRPGGADLPKSLLKNFGKTLPSCNIYFVRLIQQVIQLTPQDNIEAMLEYHLRATEAMRICYPANHPALAYHVMNIGIFLCKLGKHTEAKQYLDEAKAMICFVLGKGHRMFAVLQEFLVKCEPQQVT